MSGNFLRGPNHAWEFGNSGNFPGGFLQIFGIFNAPPTPVPNHGQEFMVGNFPGVSFMVGDLGIPDHGFGQDFILRSSTSGDILAKIPPC